MESCIYLIRSIYLIECHGLSGKYRCGALDLVFCLYFSYFYFLSRSLRSKCFQIERKHTICSKLTDYICNESSLQCCRVFLMIKKNEKINKSEIDWEIEEGSFFIAACVSTPGSRQTHIPTHRGNRQFGLCRIHLQFHLPKVILLSFFSHVVIYLLSFFTPHSWNCILLLLLFQGIFGMFLLSPRRYIQSVWILYVRTHCLNILSHMRVYCPKRCCVWALCPRGWTIMIPKACGNTIKKTGQIWADNIKCGRI